MAPVVDATRGLSVSALRVYAPLVTKASTFYKFGNGRANTAGLRQWHTVSAGESVVETLPLRREIPVLTNASGIVTFARAHRHTLKRRYRFVPFTREMLLRAFVVKCHESSKWWTIP